MIFEKVDDVTTIITRTSKHKDLIRVIVYVTFDYYDYRFYTKKLSYYRMANYLQMTSISLMGNYITNKNLSLNQGTYKYLKSKKK